MIEVVAQGQRFELHRYIGAPEMILIDWKTRQRTICRFEEADQMQRDFDALVERFPQVGPDNWLGVMWWDLGYGAGASEK